MREIKFRGIGKKHKHMVYGFLSMNYSFDYIITEVFEHNPTQSDPCGGVDSISTVVDEKTIGQYSGFSDFKGNDIYKGDITEDKFGNIEEVKLSRSCAAFMIGSNILSRSSIVTRKNIVIGNTPQNPELLE